MSRYKVLYGPIFVNDGGKMTFLVKRTKLEYLALSKQSFQRNKLTWHLNGGNLSQLQETLKIKYFSQEGTRNIWKLSKTHSDEETMLLRIQDQNQIFQ